MILERGLAEVNGLSEIVTANNVWAELAIPLGRKFLRFFARAEPG